MGGRMRHLLWMLLLVVLLAGASANKCIAATCCCETMNGNYCCAEVGFCGWYIPGCNCKMR
jgi:hypothetical protein